MTIFQDPVTYCNSFNIFVIKFAVKCQYHAFTYLPNIYIIFGLDSTEFSFKLDR